MIVIKDTLGNVFGGYFSQSLEVKEDFYGTGESFLFKQSVSCPLIISNFLRKTYQTL